MAQETRKQPSAFKPPAQTNKLPAAKTAQPVQTQKQPVKVTQPSKMVQPQITKMPQAQKPLQQAKASQPQVTKAAQTSQAQKPYSTGNPPLKVKTPQTAQPTKTPQTVKTSPPQKIAQAGKPPAAGQPSQAQKASQAQKVPESPSALREQNVLKALQSQPGSKSSREALRFSSMSEHELEDYLFQIQVDFEKSKARQGAGTETHLPPGIVFDRRKDDDRRLGLKLGRRANDIKIFDNRLSVAHLKKNFGLKHVVKDVGFYIRGGDVAGLLGPNGAGKTTIFYMIVGFLRPSDGAVRINEHDITLHPMYKRARRGIAYLPQEASIFRKLSVEQNIYAVLETRRDLTKSEKKHRMDELIEDFGIDRIRKQAGYTLSGGERRRTEIARALAIEPKFLLLDEPFAGIDPIAVYDIKQIIRKLADRGIGILITDHNVRDTLEITNDAFIISDGRIVARGTRDMILNNQMVRDIYLGADFKM